MKWNIKSIQKRKVYQSCLFFMSIEGLNSKGIQIFHFCKLHLQHFFVHFCFKSLQNPIKNARVMDVDWKQSLW
jgi:hypothetical protein